MVAARSSAKTRTLQVALEQLRLLEARVSDKKRDTYEPMIDLLGKMLSWEDERETDPDLVKKLRDFASWVVIYGSDEAVVVFRNFMQATYSNTPAAILIRLWAEFQIAARRDMGDPATAIQPVHVVGMRITDLYDVESPHLYLTLTEPFADACKRNAWTAPWTIDVAAAVSEAEATQTDAPATGGGG